MVVVFRALLQVMLATTSAPTCPWSHRGCALRRRRPGRRGGGRRHMPETGRHLPQIHGEPAMSPHRVWHRNLWQVGWRSHRTPVRPRPGQGPREAPPYLRGASAGAYTSRWAWPSQPNGRSRRACSSCPWVGSTWCWRTRATTRAHRPVVYLWEGGCTWDTGKKEMSRCFDSSAFRDCIVRIVVAQVSTVPYICTQNIRTCLTFGCPCSLVKKNHLVFFIETTLQSWVAWGSSWGGRTGTMSVHEGQPSKFPTWKALPLGHKESQGAGAGQCQSGRTIEVVQRKSNWGNLAIPISNHSKRNFAW